MIPELKKQHGLHTVIVAPRRLPARCLHTLFRAGAEFVLRVIGPVTRIETIDPPSPPINWDLIAVLCLSASIALMLITIGHYGGRRSESWAPLLFWGGVMALFLPMATRISWPTVSRGERILLLLILALSIFAIKLLYAPTAFAHYDEFLHWVTASDILESHRLFLENSLLPVSPLYPGLEILTTALANLTGLSVFPASVAVLAVLRGLCICALFLLYERVCGSPRIAAIACLVYMGNSNFVFFDAQFAYQSLAIVLFILALLAEAVSGDDRHARWSSLWALVLPFLAALAVTHHVSAYFAALFLVLLAALDFLRPNTARERARVAFVAASAVALPIMWSWLIGNPSADYLGPVFERGMSEVVHFIGGGSGTREFFVAADGSRTPIWLQAIGITAVAIIALGLATGFLRSIAMSSSKYRQNVRAALFDILVCQWRNSRFVLLTLVTLGFPLSIALRLTTSGWEIGNRMGPFVFLGVGLVTAVSIVCFSQQTWWRAQVVGVALTVVFLGGVVTGWGVPAERSPYKVSADALSVEPMGVEAALWSRTWLGEGNRFATDRINRLLAATYGRQDVVTSLYDRIVTTNVFFARTLSAGELGAVKAGNVDYLLVDLRLSEAAPFVGHYFEQGESEAVGAAPPEAAALLKFNDLDRVSRVFDNGWIVIFDVRSLRDAR